MTAIVVPAEIIEAKRRAREKQRQQREAHIGTILNDEPEPQCAPASPARAKETKL